MALTGMMTPYDEAYQYWNNETNRSVEDGYRQANQMAYTPNDPEMSALLTDWYRRITKPPELQQAADGSFAGFDWTGIPNNPNVARQEWLPGKRQRTTFLNGNEYTAQPYEDKGTFLGEYIPSATQALMTWISPAAGAGMSAMRSAGKGEGLLETGLKAGATYLAGSAAQGASGAGEGALNAIDAGDAYMGAQFTAEGLGPYAGAGGMIDLNDAQMGEAFTSQGIGPYATPPKSDADTWQDLGKTMGKTALQSASNGMMGSMESFTPQDAPTPINTNYSQIPLSQLTNLGMITQPKAYTDPAWRPGITDINTDPLNPNYATDYSIMKQKELEEKKKKRTLDLAPDLGYLNGYLA